MNILKAINANVERMKCAVIETLNCLIINTLNMKNKLWKTIKSRRFLYALLTAVLLYAFAVGSSRLWQWLIPWRGLEIAVWFVVLCLTYGCMGSVFPK